MNSGPVIREARKRKGWSQQKLADEIRSSQAAVSRMENGDEVLTQADIAALCEALGLSWSDFDPAQVA